MDNNSAEKNKNLCKGCSLCCEYVCVEIDKPETKNDYDQIIWMLLHKDVWVYFDDKNEWYVQFNTQCEVLTNDKLCGIYHNRPRICRKHSQDSCERYGEGTIYKKIFRKKEDFIQWLKEKKVNYNFKGFEH